MPNAAASTILAYLQQLHQRFADLGEGQVATYIPELSRADPRHFGIVVATVDGQVYEVGDSRQPFTIQSISKPLVYGVALDDRGREQVREHVGVEPSGEAFNSISLEPGTGRPLNPMINAGAIATTSLVMGETEEARLARVLGAISDFAGRPLTIDEAVFESERDTGHRNRAIGHMLRSYGIVPTDPEPTLALYFKQCSIVVDCRDLALIGATLANGGQNPVTGRRAVTAEHVSDILSVMTTCGVYDFAGEWVTRVGMPAKSGVGGGIVAVLPGQLGIGVFSPALDARGNSVRGVKACEALSAELGLHFLRPPRAAAATVRARYTLERMRSKRRRPAQEIELLERDGDLAMVFELQGDLRFSTLEPVLRAIEQAERTPVAVVLDFKRVTQVDSAAATLLARMVEACAHSRQHLVLSRVRRDGTLSSLGGDVNPRLVGAMSFQPQLDAALEWCERLLIERHGVAHAATRIACLADHQLCAGLSEADVAFLDTLVQRRSYEPGSVLFQRDDPADALFLMLAGEVSVVVSLPGGGVKRLSTLVAGMTLGEAALIDGGVRSANVRADTQVDCGVLTRAAFAAIESDRPALALRLLRNLMRSGAETMVRLTAEVSALEA